MHINDLFPELLIACLTEFIQRGDEDYLAFARKRITAANVCIFWRTALLSTATMWTDISVTQHVPVQVLAQWISCTANAPLQVTISLRNIHLYYRHGHPSDRAVEYIRRALPLLVQKISMWSSLVLEIEDTACICAVVEMLADLSVPALSSLTTAFPTPYHGIILLDKQIRAANSISFFRGGTPSLKHFTVASTALDWKSTEIFRNLISFELGELHPGYLPSMEDYRAVLQSATQLAQLKLGPIHLLSSDLSHRIDIEMPELKCLTLVFKRYDDTGALASNFVMRALSTLSISLPDCLLEEFTDCFSRNPEIFSGVVSLTVNGKLHDWVPPNLPQRLFRHFTKIETLDLNIDPNVFWQLVDLKAFRPIFKFLRHLTVGQVSVRMLRKYVERGGYALQHLWLRDFESSDLTESELADLCYVLHNVPTRMLQTCVITRKPSRLYPEPIARTH
ncbi:hypothetical protein C8J57DRAFT_1537074 [Mycena rebaudengoi]|nr:hypothetical protein C8J57DRAFT_1540936 [Mycena rebaudengoi]KAJ7219778.1 hypothetical protein C8J57DRAFT_1537074 [Mycena rebaudengoi]